MNLTYQLIKTHIDGLDKNLCQKMKAVDDGKKFSLLVLKKLSGYRSKNLEKFYTDGGGDHQVDGVCINEKSDELEINIITCKLAKTKPESTFSDKDVSDFVTNGISYLLWGEENVTDLNDRIKQVKKELDELREAYENNYIINVKFVSNSDDVLNHNSRHIFMKFQSDLNSKGVSINFEEINSKKLSALFSTRSVVKTTVPIKLSGKSYYQLSGKEGFVCRLPVQEIIKLYFGFEDGEKKYGGYGDFLFTDNVRKNLGLERKINKKIYETATTTSLAVDFEYFNNGLTVIYDELAGSLSGDSPILYIKGLQIVNGCQTVSTLIKAHEDKKLIEDIYVTCRFIKRIEHEDFIQSVITYTNSQNAISDRDLHANDRIQYEVQGILKSLGILYERKQNEFKDEDDDKRLDALDAAQAYLCCELEEPHNAKQKKRKLFNDFYGRIFDTKKIDLAYRLVISARVMEYVIGKQLENRKRKSKTKKAGKNPKFRILDLIIAHGSYHIATFIYRESYKSLSEDKIKKEVKKKTFSKDIITRYNEGIKKIEQYVEKHQINREDLPKFFKINPLVI